MSESILPSRGISDTSAAIQGCLVKRKSRTLSTAGRPIEARCAFSGPAISASREGTSTSSLGENSAKYRELLCQGLRNKVQHPSRKKHVGSLGGMQKGLVCGVSRIWSRAHRAVGPLFAVGSTAQARRAAWGTPASASLTSASFVMRTMALRTPYAKPLRKCCAVPMNSQISAHITHSPRATREWMLVPLRATLSVWLGEIRMTPRISRCLLRRSTSTRE